MFNAIFYFICSFLLKRCNVMFVEKWKEDSTYNKTEMDHNRLYVNFLFSDTVPLLYYQLLS